MVENWAHNKKYKEAAIVFSVSSMYYLLIFFWKGISSRYGMAYYISIGVLVFLMTVVPYFIYKGSRGWALTFAWIYLIRALGNSWAVYKGMGHGIVSYVLPTIFICTFMLFRAGWKKNKL